MRGFVNCQVGKGNSKDPNQMTWQLIIGYKTPYKQAVKTFK